MRRVDRGHRLASADERIAQCGWLNCVLALAVVGGFLVVAYRDNPGNLASPGVIFLAAYISALGLGTYRASLTPSAFLQMSGFFGAASGFAVLGYLFAFDIGPAFLAPMAVSLVGAGYVLIARPWRSTLLLIPGALVGAAICVSALCIGINISG